MTKLSIVAGFAVLSLAPAFGLACEYDAATSASAAPPARLASAPAPEATRVPAAAASAAKAPASRKVAKETEDRKDASRSDVKVAAPKAS